MQRTYPAGLYQIGFWVSVFQVGCDPLEESADMLREAVFSLLWVMTLRLWVAAAAAAAAEASEMQCGAGGFRSDATVTPSAAKM